MDAFRIGAYEADLVVVEAGYRAIDATLSASRPEPTRALDRHGDCS